MTVNWVDLVVVLVIVLSALQGWRTGAIRLLGSLIAILAAFWFAVHLARPTGIFLQNTFGLQRIFGEILAYAGIAILAQWLIGLLLNHLISKLPVGILGSPVNYGAGIAFGIVNGITILAFFLLAFLFLPISGSLHGDITNSRLGSPIVDLAKKYSGDLASSIDSAAKATSRYMTSGPDSGNRVSLSFIPKTTQFSTDAESETQMLSLINGARSSGNVPALRMDSRVRDVARAHSIDMFQKQYFSDDDLSGQSGEERLRNAGVTFSVTGESIAYGIDASQVFGQFMNSVSHKQNILAPEFKRVGIGIADGGMYGKMITIDFVD